MLARLFPSFTGNIRIVANLGLNKKLVGLIGQLPTKDLLYLYGDSVYINSWGIIGAFKGKLIKYIIKDLEQKVFNREMVELYITVKYGFRLVSKY